MELTERYEIMNKYIRYFLDLKCAGDILNACYPINEAEKEITEAMAMIQRIKPIVLEKKMHYILLDLCAGNALTSIIAVHLLPIWSAVAVDKKPPIRNGHQNVKRFQYYDWDIFGKSLYEWVQMTPFPMILTATHPCANLASRIIHLYCNLDQVKHLILMPCCVGKDMWSYPEVIRNKLGPYWTWSMDLALRVNGKLVEDKNVLSPCNAIIVASKE